MQRFKLHFRKCGGFRLEMTRNFISQKPAASAVCLDTAEQTTELIEALRPELAYLVSTCGGLAKHCGEIKEAIRLSILTLDYVPRESGATAISLFDYCDLHGEIESIATELSALAEDNHEAERVSSIAKRIAEHLRLGLLQIANLRMQGRVTHLDYWGNDKSTNSKRTLSPLVEHLVFPGVIEISGPIRHFFEDLRLVHSDGEIPPALQSLMPNGIFLAHVLA